MRIFGILSVLLLLTTSSLLSQTILKERMDFNIQDATISEALQQLRSQSETSIAFSSSLFEGNEKITLDLKSKTFEFVLKKILASTDVSYKSLNGQIVLYLDEKVLQHTISGYLQDEPTGEKLVFATVYCRKNQKGTTSNEYGFYSLTLPPGKVELIYNYVGSESAEKHVDLQGDLSLDVSLNPGALLAEVIVESNEESLGQSVGFEAEGRIPMKFFEAVPGLGGESDVMRTAQMLPGIQTGADGSGGMYVRGGEAGQNLILLDGVPVYNPSHLLGIFSVFNSSAVRSVHLLKGGFPARYGGGISSVFDIRTREGSHKKWNIDAGLGLFSGRLSVDGPIIKDKLSLMVTARRSHSTFFFTPSFKRAFTEEGEVSEGIDFNFYDVNAKLNYKISNRDQLIFSYYFGGDFFLGKSFDRDEENSGTRVKSELRWGNQAASLRWNHQYSKKLFSNTTLTYSNYDFNNRREDLDYENGEFDEFNSYFDFGSSIRDYAASIDFDYIPISNHRVRAGAGIRLQENGVIFFGVDGFELVDTFLIIDENFDFTRLNSESQEFSFSTTELFAYLEDDFTITPKWKANLGLRLVTNSASGSSLTRLEPRVSTHYVFNKKWSIQASLSKMSQYLHKVSFSSLQHPGDFWVPSVDGAKPQTSWQGGLGLNHNINQNMSLSVEGYYKAMKNLLSVGIEGEDNIFMNELLNEIGLVRGKGKAYGIEFLLQQQGLKTGGWLSYSLAWSKRQIISENGNAFFPFQYDSRHQLKLFLYHQFSDHFQIGLNWIFYSPSPYLVLDENPLSITALNEDINPEGQFNILRSDAYHRLDLNATYEFYTGKRFRHSIKLGIFNLYNRKNTLYHQIQYFGQGVPADLISPVSLLPFLPSLQYGVKF